MDTYVESLKNVSKLWRHKGIKWKCVWSSGNVDAWICYKMRHCRQNDFVVVLLVKQINIGRLLNYD